MNSERVTFVTIKSIARRIIWSECSFVRLPYFDSKDLRSIESLCRDINLDPNHQQRKPQQNVTTSSDLLGASFFSYIQKKQQTVLRSALFLCSTNEIFNKSYRDISCIRWMRFIVWLFVCWFGLSPTSVFNVAKNFIIIIAHRFTQCAKCQRKITSTDWIRRAKQYVFHLACFSCDSCDRQLSTGEEFALIQDQILCREHYLETIEGETTSSDGKSNCWLSQFHLLNVLYLIVTISSYIKYLWIIFDLLRPVICGRWSLHTSSVWIADSYFGGDDSSKKKIKRVRTAFTEEQLEVLQRNFEIDSNPDGQDLERIALNAGLSKRVTQVWFQNARARQKKHTHLGKRKGNGNTTSEIRKLLVFPSS